VTAACGKALLLLFAAIVIYLPALRGDFVWDDGVMLTRNKLIAAADGLPRIWFGTESPDYFPATSTSFWIEWRLWKTDPLGYHAVNVLLHAASAVLLWRILSRLNVPGAWLASLFFTLHPVNVESVAWIAERKNTLSMFFYLAAIILFFRHEADKTARAYCLALGLFLLALLSKTSVVMLPAVLLLCAWWKRGKLERGDWVRTAPFFALSLAAGLATIWFQNRNAIAGASIPIGGFFQRLAVAGAAVWFYLFNALAPFKLSFVYPRWRVDGASLVWHLPGLSLLGLILFAARFRKTWGRAVLFGLGYFILSLFPVLGFFKMYYMRFSQAADQWAYIPMAGVIALAAAGSAVLARRAKLSGKPPAVFAAAVLGILAWNRAGLFKNDGTFWGDVLKRDPASWVAQDNFAVFLMRQGKIDEALPHAQKSVEIKPDYAQGRVNLGIALEKKARVEEAILEFEKAVELQPNYPDAHFNLGVALDAKGRPLEAIAQYREALRRRSEDADTHNDLAVALEKVGRIDEAIAHYSKAVVLNPGLTGARLNLGSALYRENRVDEAITQFQEILKLSPDSPQAHNNLGGALYEKGRLDEAITQYRRALRLKPDFAEARANLAALLDIKNRDRH